MDDAKATRISSIIDSLDVHSSSDPGLVINLKNILGGYKDDTTYDLIENSIAADKQKPRPDGVFFSATIAYGTEQGVREAAYYRMLVPDYINLGTLQSCLRGLRLLECYRDIKLEELTGSELNIVLALINVSIKFIVLEMDENELGFYYDDNGRSSVLIENSDLIDLIADNHQQVDSIIRFIEDRHSADPAALHEYLNDTTALQNGTL